MEVSIQPGLGAEDGFSGEGGNLPRGSIGTCWPLPQPQPSLLLSLFSSLGQLGPGEPEQAWVGGGEHSCALGPAGGRL